MTIETPCRVRDGVGFLEPTSNDREPLHWRGVHALSLSKGSLKRMRGTHLRGQVHKETPRRHRGGGYLLFRFPAALPDPVSPLI